MGFCPTPSISLFRDGGALYFAFATLFMVRVNGIQMLFSNFFTAIGDVLRAGPVADFIAFVVSVFLVSREFKVLAARQETDATC